MRAELPVGTKLRSSKYLNNLIEQDRRGVKIWIGPMLGFKQFRTAVARSLALNCSVGSTRDSSTSGLRFKGKNAPAVWNGRSLQGLRIGLSASYFARAFKCAFRERPHRRLLRQRVKAAEKMLAGSESSIAVVAIACGFAGQSHLTRVLSGIIGVPPGAWRRRNDALQQAGV
jgi:hypothetical protein